MAASSGRKSVSNVVEVEMSRLSKGLLDQFGVDLNQSDLKKLGFLAEKRPNNPNTYYKVPGISHYIENCPKVLKHIKDTVALGNKAEIAALFGKGVVPKAPSPTQARKRGAPIAADAAGAKIKKETDHSPDQDKKAEAAEAAPDEEMKEASPAAAAATSPVPAAAAAATAGSKTPVPAGYVLLDDVKTAKVLSGLALHVKQLAEVPNMDVALLRDKGVVVIEESKPLAPGERMRHAYVWWDGVLDEPVRCAQYMYAASNFLKVPAVKQALGLGSTQKTPHSAGSKKRPASAAAAAAAGEAPLSAPPAVKRTRASLAEAEPALTRAHPAAGSGGNVPSISGAVRRREQLRQEAAAAAPGGGDGSNRARASHIPISPTETAAAASEGKIAAAAVAGGGGSGGKVRGPSGRFVAKSEATAAGAAAGAAGGGSGRGAAAANLGKAGNQQVLDSVDDAVALLDEALELGAMLPPSVLNSLPAVFTASLDGTLQEFLSQATAMRNGLKTDRELLMNMAADYVADPTAAAQQPSSSSKSSRAAATAESHYRKPYLAFRAALGVCAADAHNWLQDKQQREMIARLEGLVQIKKQLEDKKTQEEQLRLEQEQMRAQKEMLEQELRAYKERLQRLEEEAKRKAAVPAGEAPATAPAEAADAGTNGTADQE